MDLKKVTQMLIDVLVEIQEDSGRPIPEKVDKDTCPFLDFPGFDSLNCVEASVDLSTRLGCPVKHDIFFSNTGPQLLTIGDIAVRIVEVINLEGEPNE